jgi:LmbE family N-acetylglucosaminyl deacetylase
MSRRCAVALLCLLMNGGPAAAQVVSEHQGAIALGLALRRLGVTKRVLMIGAHPDDENTTAIAELALGQGADVAYLSLTRGEGGQNLIGAELEEGLGLTRTEELLSARRLDGAQQFFTRAYDFGYSKSAAEAFRKWPRDELLSDVVEVVRRFRPDIITPVFSGTPQDGHGQHQVSGIMAREAFTAAADPSRFPEQLVRGLQPHRTSYLIQVLYRRSDAAPFVLPTGDLDPLLGRSRFQIAMASRSRHRSQDMGQAEAIGPQSTWVLPVAGPFPAGARSLFAGLDTTLLQHATRSGNAAATDELRSYERETAELRAQFNPLRSSDLVVPLARAVGRLIRADSLASNLPSSHPLRLHIRDELPDAEEALWRAAGIVVDATADDAFVEPGQTLVVTLTVWNGGSAPVTIDELAPRLGRGLSAEPLDSAVTHVPASHVAQRRFRIHVDRNAPLSIPYFLRRPRNGELYAWPEDSAARARPFEPAAIRAIARLRIAGAPARIEREATFVEVDKSKGEIRRPVLVVPRVHVAVDPPVRIVALGTVTARAFDVTVVLATGLPEDVPGRLILDLPAGWKAEPEGIDLELPGGGEEMRKQFRVTPPAQLAPGDARIIALFRANDGEAYDQGYRIIAHEHTRPRLLFEPARVAVSAFNVSLEPGLAVGYVPGAGDGAAQALEQLGANVTTLDGEALARADLGRFAAIVTGMRAYEVNRDFIANHARLLEYARNGGTVIVQYNKYELVEGSFAPYPLTMARPHGRVADENAPVRLLEPEHPLFTTPNRITEQDFAGWVQERGLYFAETWDARYRALLEMHDESEPPQRGSVLVADVGRGTWVYCALALFRQWPEGVPGAYRLLANLVSLRR